MRLKGDNNRQKDKGIQMRYRQTPHNIFGYNPEARPSNAGAIWRTLCWVNDKIAVSGDLSDFESEAVAQLQKWVSEGVTDIIDLRGEASHESLVARIAPQIKYHWLGLMMKATGALQNGLRRSKQQQHWYLETQLAKQ